MPFESAREIRRKSDVVYFGIIIQNVDTRFSAKIQPDDLLVLLK